LVELLRPLPAKAKVNLIPYNRNLDLGAAGGAFEPSAAARVEAFRRVVSEAGCFCSLLPSHPLAPPYVPLQAGYFCSVRAQRGAGEAAACGMLATQLATATASRRTRERGVRAA